MRDVAVVALLWPTDGQLHRRRTSASAYGPRHGPYLALRTKPWSRLGLVDADAVVAGPSSHRRRPPLIPPLAVVLPQISSPTPASMMPVSRQHGCNPGDSDLLPNCPLFDLDAGETSLPTQPRRRCYPHCVGGMTPVGSRDYKDIRNVVGLVLVDQS
jgi:hypothetical protein